MKSNRGVGQRGKTRRRFVPTREWLYAKYVEEGLSAREVCELTGYSPEGLHGLLVRYDIDRKGRSLPKLAITRDELYQLHVVEGLTAVKIAARLGCHNSAISRLIKQYELDPGRPLVNVPVQPPLTRDELWKLYWVDQLSHAQIAEQYQTSKSTVARWFKILDIATRKWNGGETNGRTYTRTYTKANRMGCEFNAYERERIFDRDQRRCRMPGCHQTDRLEVHHILPIKYGGTNALDNGITLCHDCHERIKFREMSFILLFQDLALNP